MPPQDTIYIPGETGLPPQVNAPYADTLFYNSLDSLPDSIRQIVDSLMGLPSYQYPDKPKEPNYPFPEGVMFLFILAVAAISAYLYVVRPAQREKKKRNFYKPAQPSERAAQEVQYDQWLCKYNPYYNSLSASLKKSFLHRTQKFRESKEFRFHSMVEEEYIPALVSASAVQLTFGLRNYLMDYFDVIHVMRKEYVLNIDKETYYGHVSKNGIHVSWSRFLEGYSDYTDSENVGLHEMAHALSYDIYLGFEDTHDRDFKNRLFEFAEEGRIAFRSMRQNRNHLFDDYALTNFDEFWATSIEIFFENPTEFKEKLPELYREISELLNQDPLLAEKVIDPSLFQGK